VIRGIIGARSGRSRRPPEPGETAIATPPPTAPTVDDLRQLDFFDGLSDAAVGALAALSRWETAAEGATVISEGDPAEVARVLVEGRVSLALRIPGRRDEVVSTLSTGELLGWSALTPGRCWNASARAVKPCIFIAMPRAALVAHCDADPALGYALMRRAFDVVAARLHDTRLQLTDMFHARR